MKRTSGLKATRPKLARLPATNAVSAASVVQRIMAAHGGADGASEDLAEVATPARVSSGRARPQGDPGIVVDGDDDVWVKLARCCTPVPGDEVLGFVTRGHGVSVHRLDCVNVASLRKEPDRIVPVTWAPRATSVFLVNIQVEALDRARLLSDGRHVMLYIHGRSAKSGQTLIIASEGIISLKEPLERYTL